MSEGADEDLTYDTEVRAEIAITLNATAPGEWAELALCPGSYGCPFETIAEAMAAGVEQDFCDSCRVIHLYRGR